MLVTVVLVAVLFVGVFPTRTYLAQRASTGAAQEKLEVLREQNELLEARARQLHDHAEIERLARERYNLVRPGEEAYAVLPPPSVEEDDEHGAPPPAPNDDRNLLERAWDGLTGFF
ncbi:MAG TPA: septum formation initiator family protein [Acidimicrobiales bacterium]|nr:septum formation initiator family protein [Acidimicrobiales bacterium]